MMMNSYRYYASEYRGRGTKDDKKEDLDRNTDLFFII